MPNMPHLVKAWDFLDGIFCVFFLNQGNLYFLANWRPSCPTNGDTWLAKVQVAKAIGLKTETQKIPYRKSHALGNRGILGIIPNKI